MKILMTSEFFYPHIGGIETVTEYLADEFSRMGHEVKIITNTTQIGTKSFPYEILRKPSVKRFWRVYKWCDVFVHQGISLKRIWPLFLIKKPWFVVYHMVDYQEGILGRIKKCTSLFSHNIAVSQTTKQGYKLRKAEVILNSYDSKQFYLKNDSLRRDFVYLGKLYKSKGVHLLIKAFEEFKEKSDSDWNLTLIGGCGDDELDNLINLSPYNKNICRLGFKYPDEIVDILNHHKVQIVPSLYKEAFGVVVLEGMACGCIVIGSDGDGIQEAMGKAGFTFKKGSVDSLCQKMIETYNLSDSDYQHQQFLMKENLEKLSLHNVAKKYIQIFSKYIR